MYRALYCALAGSFCLLLWGVYLLTYDSVLPVSDDHAFVQARVLFPIDDAPLDDLVALIDQEPDYIRVAAYRLTDDAVARALVRAAKRGVTVSLIADAAAFEARYNKVLTLLTHHIDVAVFPPCQRYQDDESVSSEVSSQALMHNKYMIFQGLANVWTGSYNFTKAARTMHQENIVILLSYMHTWQYIEAYQRLYSRSTPITERFAGC